MKTALIYTIIGLLAINSLTAQVKIGDNPQNLNPASLLELESTSRALVISRVTDAQMSAISPLRGALVYNTDQNCLHYYDGTAWINICEALDDSFTVSTRDDYMSQLYSNTLDSTVVITTTDNGDGSTNYNFEVGEITGSNIQDFSIEGRDIVNRTIAGDKIASRSVNPLRIFNDGDDLTRQVLLWNGNVAPDGEWQRISESDLQISEADGVIGNEVVGPFDTTLRLEGSGDEIDPYTLDVSEGGITDFEIATGAVTSDEILNGTILEEDIANDAVTITKIGTAGATDADKILTTDGAGDPQWEDRTNFASSALNSGDIFVGDATNTATGITMGGDATIDNTGQVTIQPDAVTTAEIGTAGATDADKVLTTDGAGDPIWEDRTNFASSALNSGDIFVGDATNTATGVTMGGDATIDNTGQVTIQPDAVTTVEIGTAGATDADKVLTTDGAGDPIWENRTNFASSALNSGNIFVGDATNTATGVTMGGDATIDNTGQVTIQPDVVTTAEIGTAGATDADKVLTTDGAGDPQWEDRINFASSALTDGNIFVGDATNTATGVAMGGDATIDNTGQVTIQPDAVTTVEIGTAGATDADKVLTTDGAGDPIWENRTNFTSSALNSGNIFVGDATNTATGVTMGGDANIDNTGQVTIQPDAVTTVEIGTAGATDADKVLTTDGAGDPIWEDRTNFASSALNSGDIFVGDATNTATGVSMGGDATIDNTGQLSIADDVVDAATINNDVAGNGLVQDGGTGALDVNVDDATIEVNTDQLRVKPSTTDGDILVTTGTTVSWQPPAVVAMGKVDALLNPANTKLKGASVVNDGPGVYTVTFDSPRNDANYIIQLTLSGAADGATIQVQNQTNTNFRVSIIQPQIDLVPNSVGIITQDNIGPPTVDAHNHDGVTDFFITTEIRLENTNADWYFTITDF